MSPARAGGVSLPAARNSAHRAASALHDGWRPRYVRTRVWPMPGGHAQRECELASRLAELGPGCDRRILQGS